MKIFPQHWGTRHVAYFAGIVSAHLRIGDLVALVDECIASNPDRVLLFSDLIEKVEPRISRDQWDGCVENCERLFCRQHLEAKSV